MTKLTDKILSPDEVVTLYHFCVVEGDKKKTIAEFPFGPEDGVTLKIGDIFRREVVDREARNFRIIALKCSDRPRELDVFMTEDEGVRRKPALVIKRISNFLAVPVVVT